MHRLRFLLSISVFFLASPAWAEEPTEEARAAADEHSRLGVEHYSAGRYPDAVKEMLLAWQAVPDPGLLYNVARIYQAMEETDLAIEFLQRFVSDPGADPETVQKALQHLTDLREAEPEQPQAELPVLEVEAPPPQDPLFPVSPEIPISTPSKAGLQGSQLLLGTGLATLATRGVLGWKAVQAQRQYSDSTLDMDVRLDAAESGQRQALLADLSMVGGAILFGSGTWLTFRETSLGLALGPGNLVLSVSR